MNQETPTPAPDEEPTWTLYRFCLRHGLFLNDHERSTEGVELSKLARERGLPLIKTRERVAPRQWSQSRLYPESFLTDWLARYMEAKARAAADGLSEPQRTAANS